MPTTTSFPVGGRVLLQKLAKGAHLNGKQGIVKSSLDSASLRQNVFVADANKTMAVKPANLCYEPREIESLSIVELIDLILYSKTKQQEELEVLLNEKCAGKEELQKIVQSNVSRCPDELAALVRVDLLRVFDAFLSPMYCHICVLNLRHTSHGTLNQQLAKITIGDKSFAARLEVARSKGGWSSSEKMSPADYLKRQYRQSSKRDKKEESELSCQACGKSHTNLSKCSRCLSAWYCSKECQKKHYSQHKLECNELLKQRITAVQNDVDDPTGLPPIPYIGIALSESITGVPGEVLCDLPQWDYESGSEVRKVRNVNLNKVTRAIKYFFKTYQSSVAAAKSLSVNDIGDMCTDANLLFWLKCPGVRRISATEGRSDQRERLFSLEFSCVSCPPPNWKFKAEHLAQLSPQTVALFEDGIKQLRNDIRFTRR